MDPEHAATGCVESVQNKAVSNRSKKKEVRGKVEEELLVQGK